MPPRHNAGGLSLWGSRYRVSITTSLPVEGGTQYVSSLTIGTIGPCAEERALNPLVHRAVFTEAMGHAWLRHNGEEVGLLEHIVPLIYPRGGCG